MKVREVHDIIIEKYPYHESLNKRLMVDMKSMNFFTPDDNLFFTNIRARQFNFNKDNPAPETVKTIVKWVENLIRAQCSDWFDIQKYGHAGEKYSIDIATANWIALYNKGEETWKHDHKQCLLGYVYFVHSPPGSSPLVFSTTGKKVKPEEGTVVVFPGTVSHHVPKNNCDGRITLAGNITFELKS